MKDWQQNQQALQHHLKHDKLETLLRWSTIEKTMFVGDVDYVRLEYNEITRDSRFTADIIKETQTGNPKLLWGWTSGNLIHQYYHLKQWLDKSQLNIRELSAICEIGAGYGAMALLCRRLGFEGAYHIIDLPELKQIQIFYLSETIGVENVVWLDLPQSCDLFIASHSLSEMPLSEREKLLSQVAAKEYLFASSYEFEGVDNQRWFQRFAGSTVGVDWVFYAHPYQENAFYQVGVGYSGMGKYEIGV